MGLYNFKPQFVPFILDGSKTHTIRAERKHNDMPGDTMHLYTGLRHPGARLLFRARCVKTEFVRIDPDHSVRIGARCDLYNPEDSAGAAVPGGFIILDDSEKEQLSKRDGFSSFHHMIQFWDGRLPFEGWIIHWDYSTRNFH